MKFAKYQGIGNDFIMLADPGDRLELTPGLVVALCDRRFGVGADGVIRVAPPPEPNLHGAELFMDYVNSDGSVGEMCGNGIRCLALFARSEGLSGSQEIPVATRAGLKTVALLGGNRIRVDMGAPVFATDRIPVDVDGDPLHAKLEVEDEVVEVACLSMGNPHAVVFVDDPPNAPVSILGPRLENHSAFPNKANVEFAHVASPRRIEMRVWERGSGETLACGTGACAVAVASRLLAGADERMSVALPGGELEIEWSGSLEDEQPVLMTGPAVKSFEGEIDLEDLPR
jgi:diaminopimelate epimerase